LVDDFAATIVNALTAIFVLGRAITESRSAHDLGAKIEAHDLGRL